MQTNSVERLSPACRFPKLGPPSTLALRGADIGEQAVQRSYRLFQHATSLPPGIIERMSATAALRAAEHAHRRVPAYRLFVAQAGALGAAHLPAAERLRQLPAMDKENYVKVFETEQRCLDGRIPTTDVTIDESAGSSGTPFNWVRSAAEMQAVQRDISQFARYLIGTDVITINGFSMGAWATGINVGEALRHIGIVKSTGPDIDKILHTLQFLGSRHTYIITGYPPFLKRLIDEGERRGFPWAAYRLFGLVGGEGMSEGLRKYLEGPFQAVYSAYGASDLTIGIGSELPLTVWIRQHAAANPRLQAALFGNDLRLPMLFQYNPLAYYIETNEQHELIITMNRLNVLSPRVRYNIHDAGGVLRYDDTMDILREFGLQPEQARRRPAEAPFGLPFLYLFGRSDNTISYMGANIYPEDVEQALYTVPRDARRLGAFCLELLEIGRGELRPCAHVEVLDGTATDIALAERLRQRVLAQLLMTNRDFRTAVAEDASAGDILIHLHCRGTGPFAGNIGRIKQQYILKGGAPTTLADGGN